MIDTLIIFTVNTGFLTCSASITHLVFFLVTPSTGVHFAFHFMLAKLYTNSLYASLNTRTSLRGKGESDQVVFGSTSRGTGRSMVDSMGGANFSTSVSHLPSLMRCVTEALHCVGPSVISACAKTYRYHVRHRNSGYFQFPAWCSAARKAGSAIKLGECG
jgi:Family of unknown function (DUF6534)